jgi:hypothetical protein
MNLLAHPADLSVVWRVFCLALLSPGSLAVDVPRLAQVPASLDFGSIPPRTPLSSTLAWTNSGTAPLVIRDIQVSCSCLQPGARTLTIDPGSHGTLEVGVLAPDRSGPFLETLTFACNDPDHASGTVEFRGTVFRKIEAIPDFAVLAITPDSGTNESVRIRIVNHGPEPVEIGEPRGNHPAFEARLIRGASGTDPELFVRATRPLANANHFAVFKLSTSSPEVPEVAVTVYVPGLPAVAVTPREIRLAPLPTARAEDRARTVFIRGTTDESLVVSNAVVRLPGARVALETRQPGRLFVAHLELPADFELSAHPPAELLFHTNHPQFPVVRVPIVRTAADR